MDGGVGASRAKMRVFGWLPELPSGWILQCGSICSKVMSPCFPTHWPWRGYGTKKEGKRLVEQGRICVNKEISVVRPLCSKLQVETELSRRGIKKD